VQLLRKTGVAAGATLGLETDTYGLTGRNHGLLLSELEAAGYAHCEASHISRSLRLFKSPAEVTKMREANRLCDAASMTAFRAARPGVLDAVISAAAYQAIIGGGGDLPPSWLVNSGSAVAFGRSITDSRTLEVRDEMVLEIYGVYHRYCRASHGRHCRFDKK
jgi:Xaa-Pro dipeptidase